MPGIFGCFVNVYFHPFSSNRTAMIGCGVVRWEVIYYSVCINYNPACFFMLTSRGQLKYERYVKYVFETWREVELRYSSAAGALVLLRTYFCTMSNLKKCVRFSPCAGETHEIDENARVSLEIPGWTRRGNVPCWKTWMACCAVLMLLTIMTL